MAHAAPPPRRVVPVGLAGAIAAALLSGASVLGLAPLLLLVAALQVTVGAGLLVLSAVPARRQSLALTVVAAVAADVLALRDDGDRVGDLVAVVALGLVAAVLLELLRRNRSRVTASLAVTVSAVVLVVLVAHVLALHGSADGDRLLLSGFGCVAAGLLAGFAVGRLARQAAVALSASAAVGTAVGALSGAVIEPLGVRSGAALGLAVSIAAGVAVAAFDVVMAEVGPRQRDITRPLGAVLPCAVAAPTAYVVTLLLVG